MTSQLTPEERTDSGNADKLIAASGQSLKYDHTAKRWLLWNENRWESDKQGGIYELALTVIRQWHLNWVPKPDSPARTDQLKWAVSSENRARLEAMGRLAQSRSEVACVATDFDADPGLLNCQNGTLDLKTGRLGSHRREDLITKLTAAPYVPGAEDARFEAFVKSVLPDPGIRAYVQAALGYSLLGGNPEGKLFMMIGPTHTGKTTLLEAVCHALGDYGTSTDIGSLTTSPYQDGNRPRPDLLRLFGSRLVTTTEVPDGATLDAALVKALTGGDTVTVRGLYENDYTEAVSSYTVWLGSNFKPRVSNVDDAVWDRVVQIPFMQQHAGSARDITLRDYLRDSPYAQIAILTWLVDGCRTYQERGLIVPDSVREATEEYRREMNPLHDWAQAECELKPGYWTSYTELKLSYEAWAGSRRIGSKKFAENLVLLPGVEVKRQSGTGTRGYSGIRPFKASEAEQTTISFSRLTEQLEAD